MEDGEVCSEELHEVSTTSLDPESRVFDMKAVVAVVELWCWSVFFLSKNMFFFFCVVGLEFGLGLFLGFKNSYA